MLNLKNKFMESTLDNHGAYSRLKSRFGVNVSENTTSDYIRIVKLKKRFKIDYVEEWIKDYNEEKPIQEHLDAKTIRKIYSFAESIEDMNTPTITAIENRLQESTPLEIILDIIEERSQKWLNSRNKK